MDFILPALKYIKRNFLRLLLLSLLPAALMLFTFDLGKIPQFLYSDGLHAEILGDSSGIAAIYPHFTLLNTDRIFGSVIVLLLLVLSAGITMSYIQRSIRLGKFRFSNPLERLDESFVSVMPIGILLLLLAELMGFLTSLFIMITAGIAEGAALIVIASLIVAVMYLVYFSVCAMFMFAIPCMMEVGYSMSAAVSQTLKQMQKYVVRAALILFFAFFAGAFLCYAVESLIAGPWNMIIYGIIYIAGYIYLCSLIVTGYNRINK